MYQYILAIHIIFVVCWMAGLFYMVRLFIYHTEAQAKPEPDRTILSDQFEIMERKLWYIIATPSMYLVLAAGITMVCLAPGWLQQPWLHIKLAFVGGLVVYHFICQNIMNEMRKGIYKWTSTKLRIWNEVATIFLFAIVFLAVLKNAVSWVFGLLGLILLSLILMSGVKIYKYYRAKNNKNPLNDKVNRIEKKIESAIKLRCNEEYSVIHYGAFDIDPKYLVFWICVQSDEMKMKLENMPDMIFDFYQILKDENYPIGAQKFVHLGIESQETVDRDSNGNWYHHFK